MGTGGLVAETEVGVLASFVNTERTGRIRDIEKREVIADPRVSQLTASDKVHRVRGSEGKGLILGQEEVLALSHVDIFVCSGDATAHDRILDRRFTSNKVVVSVISDVIGATGRVNLEEVDAAAISRHPDTNLVAVNSARPVSDAVSVDLATKHANGRRKYVMRSNRNGFTLGGNTEGVDAGRKGRNYANGRGHVASVLPLAGSVILERVWASR